MCLQASLAQFQLVRVTQRYGFYAGSHFGELEKNRGET